MKEVKSPKSATSETWYRIPDGTRVKHRLDGNEGTIDGLTEIVSGSQLNADGRTQYRVHMSGTVQVKLVADEDLLFLIDAEGLIMIPRQSVSYRRYVTERLRNVFQADKFVR